MSGYIVKLKGTELYLSAYDMTSAHWSGHRESAKVMNYEDAESIASTIGAVVISRHEAMGDK